MVFLRVLFSHSIQQITRTLILRDSYTISNVFQWQIRSKPVIVKNGNNEPVGLLNLNMITRKIIHKSVNLLNSFIEFHLNNFRNSIVIPAKKRNNLTW